MQINKYLVEDLKELGLWTDDIRSKIKLANGSIQKIDEVPENIKEVYRTVWEVPMRSLINMAADRSAFIDQSQSLNLFMESPDISKNYQQCTFMLGSVALKPPTICVHVLQLKLQKRLQLQRKANPKEDSLRSKWLAL